MDEIEDEEKEKRAGTAIYKGIVITFVLIVYLFIYLKLMFF